MYYMIQRNNITIDVSSTLLRCTAFNTFEVTTNSSIAHLVYSALTHTYYKPRWLPHPKQGDLQAVSDVEVYKITEEEYNNLYAALSAGIPLPDVIEEIEEPSTDDYVENNEPSIIHTAYLYSKIESLERQLKQQEQQNQMLEECILELSAELYN